MTREEMKQEALKRMQALQIHGTPRREFMQSDKLNLSENGGILYWLEDDEVKMVKEFEEKYGHVVYHVIKSYLHGGDVLYSLLYVNKDEKQWKSENRHLMQMNPYVYVVNQTAPHCSEFGSIVIRPQWGGLKRLY